MIQNIKELFEKIPHGQKNKFIMELASHVPQQANTIKQHWLSDSGMWSIPEEHQSLVLKMLQNWHANQPQEA